MSPSPDTALIVIDVQQGMDEEKFGERSSPDAERHIAELLAAWREAKRPIIHVQHMSQEPGSPFRPGLPGNAIKTEVQPEGDEPVVQKTGSSAFIGTDLEARLRSAGITDIVVTGMMTDACVSSTVRTAGNLGFNVTVVDDATATFERTARDGTHYSAAMMHGAALASMDGEFATVLSTRELLAVR